MIVDDNAVDRYVVEMIIKKTNFASEVLQAESASIAFNYLFNHCSDVDKLPDLILLDVNMPEINGFEFIEKFQTLPDIVRKHCIIMLLTSSVHPVDIDKASSNNYIAKFINKPLNVSKLMELLDADSLKKIY